MYNQGQMPGQQQPQQFPPGVGAGPQYPTTPMSPMGGVPPQRRLDPDQMPNPIQVVSENQRSNGGVFATNQVGLVPPLVTTKYVTQDQGNSGPRFIRSSMYSVPATTDMMKQSAVPFALVLSPFAAPMEQELSPPIVDLGEIGPIRCIRCKAYMSPYMQFIDAGRRFQCLLCKATTEGINFFLLTSLSFKFDSVEPLTASTQLFSFYSLSFFSVPAEYFQHLDHTGQRVDKYERPELVLGTYEFVATKDYCRVSQKILIKSNLFLIQLIF